MSLRRRARRRQLSPAGHDREEQMTSVQYVLDYDDSSHWFDIVVRETVGGATTELGTQRVVTSDLQAAFRLAAELQELEWSMTAS